jgi:hypothetical protein
MYELYRSRCKQTDRLGFWKLAERKGSVISGNRLGNRLWGYPESGLNDSPFHACRHFGY